MNALLSHLLLEAVGRSGTFDPDESLCYIEESLTLYQYETAEKFLAWCHKNKKTFGRGNIDSVFTEYKNE